MKHITLAMLTRAKACDDQRLLFKDTFGTKAELTEANMVRAIEAGLSFEWLTRLLPQPALEAYRVELTPLCTAHKAQQDPLWKAREEKQALLSEAYKMRSEHLWKKAQQALLWEGYDAQRTSLWDAYKAQRNTLLLSTLLAA